MVDIQALWGTMQRKYPSFLRSPQALSKVVRLVDPRHITAQEAGKGIEIQAKVWFKAPRKAPKTAMMKVNVTGLTLQDKVDIDPLLFQSKDPEAAMSELVRTLYLCSLLTLGIFNVPVKREAFLVMTKLKKQA